MKHIKIYRRKIVGGFFGNIFSKIVETIPGIANKVAPIAIDASKTFATGAASAAGTAVGQKIADKIKGTPVPSFQDIKQVISVIAPTARAMINTTKKLLSSTGEEIVRKLVMRTRPRLDVTAF